MCLGLLSPWFLIIALVPEVLVIGLWITRVRSSSAQPGIGLLARLSPLYPGSLLPSNNGLVPVSRTSEPCHQIQPGLTQVPVARRLPSSQGCLAHRGLIP